MIFSERMLLYLSYKTFYFIIFNVLPAFLEPKHPSDFLWSGLLPSPEDKDGSESLQQFDSPFAGVHSA